MNHRWLLTFCQILCAIHVQRWTDRHVYLNKNCPLTEHCTKYMYTFTAHQSIVSLHKAYITAQSILSLHRVYYHRKFARIHTNSSYKLLAESKYVSTKKVSSFCTRSPCDNDAPQWWVRLWKRVLIQRVVTGSLFDITGELEWLRHQSLPLVESQLNEMGILAIACLDCWAVFT